MLLIEANNKDDDDDDDDEERPTARLPPAHQMWMKNNMNQTNRMTNYLNLFIFFVANIADDLWALRRKTEKKKAFA